MSYSNVHHTDSDQRDPVAPQSLVVANGNVDPNLASDRQRSGSKKYPLYDPSSDLIVRRGEWFFGRMDGNPRRNRHAQMNLDDIVGFTSASGMLGTEKFVFRGCVDYPGEQQSADGSATLADGRGAAAGFDPFAGDKLRLGGLDGQHMGAGGEAENVVGGHQEDFFAVKAYYFGLHRTATRDHDAAARAEGQLEAGGFHHQAVDARQAAGELVGRGGTDQLAAVGEKGLPGFGAVFHQLPSPSQ